jgi:RHS repeat-associated protein
VSYGYDELGRIVSRGVPGFSMSQSHDSLGRLGRIGSPAGAFDFGYDGVSQRPLTAAYPNAQTATYSYFGNSGDRRLQQLKHLGPGGVPLAQFDYTYDAVDNIKSWRQQLGTNPARLYEFGYDAADQLQAATLKSTDVAPAILKRYGYSYDPAGNRTSEQVDDPVMADSHNARNQLASRQAGGTVTFRGTVSEPATVNVAGLPAVVMPDNRFEGRAPVPSGTSTVQVQAQDPSGNVGTNTYEISQSGQAASYTYDPNGNLISDGSSTYTWDAADRLVRVSQGSTELARFAYDGLGRRAQKVANGVTRTFVYDGEDIIEERLSTGATNRYVHGPGADQPLSRLENGAVGSYYVADHLGSVVQETTPAGVVSLTREYTPYGNLLQGAGTSGYAFAGREWDADVGLYYYRSRYYDPKLGRFLSEDPIGFDESVNFYGYVRGNPVNLIDPSGLWVTAPPDPSKNTVICDGRGGMAIQVPQLTRWTPDKRACLGECTILHELTHKQDIERASPKVCVGQAKGRLVVASGRTQAAADAQRAASERNACRAQLACLERKSAGASCECEQYLEQEIKRIRDYCDQFRD